MSVVSETNLMSSHSLDIAGNTLTERMSKSLSIDYKEAERMKTEKGAIGDSEYTKVLAPLLDVILTEIGKASEGFTKENKKGIEKVYIGGGSALLPGLREYFEKHLKKETEIMDPFKEILYPPVLEKKIRLIAPAYAVVIGLALRGLK